MEMQSGDLVRVRTYGGREIVRRLATVRGATALICNDEEYKAATKEQREPICIGFPLADVVEVVERKPGFK